MLTVSQRAAFFQLLSRAALEQGRCQDKEAYRREVMLETLGVNHLQEIGKTGDYDKIMARLAEDAHDYLLAANYLSGDVGRYRHLIVSACEAVIDHKRKTSPGCGDTVGTYCAAIMFQGRMVYRPQDDVGTFGARLDRDTDGTGEWGDIPVHVLRLLLSIVNTERRRLVG